MTSVTERDSHNRHVAPFERDSVTETYGLSRLSHGGGHGSLSRNEDRGVDGAAVCDTCGVAYG